jgi:hypothetical protein
LIFKGNLARMWLLCAFYAREAMKNTTMKHQSRSGLGARVRLTRGISGRHYVLCGAGCARARNLLAQISGPKARLLGKQVVRTSTALTGFMNGTLGESVND